MKGMLRTYVWAKGVYVLDMDFLPKRMQAIIVQNLHIINEYFKVKFVLSTTLVKDRGLGPW
jgi:hypothetical protein